MIAQLRGNIIEKNATSLVVDCAGVGYDVKISLNTYSQLRENENCTILIQMIVREDAMILYGFAQKEEKEIFNKLISVSGIGPNTALIMLSSLSPAEVVKAISSEDVRVIQSVKGIGAKTAQRVIIDLKDKISKIDLLSENILSLHNTNRFDALNALSSLGFDKKAIEKALDKVDSGTEKVEELIKKALKIL